MGQTALHVACLWGNVEAADCLIRNSADVNKANGLTGGAPLHITCSSPKPLPGRLACARLLLEAGADPSHKDDRGSSPLDYAAAEPEMLALLQLYTTPAAVERRRSQNETAALAEAAAAAVGGDEDDMPALDPAS